MNRQEVFNKVVNHLLSQNEQSVGENGRSYGCYYRGVNGLMCAVGVLIPDGKYHKDMEGQCPNDNLIVNALESTGMKIDMKMETLLYALQGVHDCKDPKDWRGALYKVSKNHQLEFCPKIV